MSQSTFWFGSMSLKSFGRIVRKMGFIFALNSSTFARQFCSPVGRGTEPTLRYHVVTPTVHTAATLTITVAIPNALNAWKYGLNCFGAARTTGGASCSAVNFARRMGLNLTVPSSAVLLQCTLQDQMSQSIDQQEAIHSAPSHSPSSS